MTQERATSKFLTPRTLLLAGIVILLVWLGVKAWRVGQAALSLQARQTELQTMLDGGLTAVDPSVAEALLTDVRRDIVIIHDETRIFFPVLPALRWIPRVGPLLADAPALIQMADAGSAAAIYAFRGLKPAIALVGEADAASNLPALLQVMDDAQPELIQAGVELERAVEALESLDDTDSLPWRVRQLLEPAADYLPLAADGIAVAQVLPDLMGLEEPKTYLFIAQNEDELRATGGFISGVGRLRVEGGRIVELTFLDANLVDDWRHKPYEFPPDVGAAALYQFMASELFLFRDANFWPDFPTSAQAMMELYSYGQGIPLDGVIATDQEFLRLLLRSLGPVTVPELSARVDANNVLSVIRSAWAPPEDADASVRSWMQVRKSFMAPLAVAIQDRLESAPVEVDLVNLVRTMRDAVLTRHLQVFVRDPAAATILQDLGWDGRLPAIPGQDIVMVVDTNVGFNKVNAVVESALSYEVALRSDGTGEATLRIDYANPVEPRAEACIHQTVYTIDTRYDQLVSDCFWNYQRIYTPAGSALHDAWSQPVPESMFVSRRAWDGTVSLVDDPTGLTVFGNFMLLEPGASRTATYAYSLPVVSTATNDDTMTYRLNWIKQPGTRPQPLLVRVGIPPGKAIVATSPEFATVAGDVVEMRGVLDRDLTLSIVYR